MKAVFHRRPARCCSPCCPVHWLTGVLYSTCCHELCKTSKQLQTAIRYISKHRCLHASKDQLPRKLIVAADNIVSPISILVRVVLSMLLRADLFLRTRETFGQITFCMPLYSIYLLPAIVACDMFGIRSMSARRCALALRVVSSATNSKNPLNELHSVQAALVCLLFYKL